MAEPDRGFRAHVPITDEFREAIKCPLLRQSAGFFGSFIAAAYDATLALEKCSCYVLQQPNGACNGNTEVTGPRVSMFGSLNDQRPRTPTSVKIDLHGYHPSDIVGPPMAKVIEQAWEMGAEKICFIHGHGRARGISPGFMNTNTGYFGLCVRRELRSNKDLRRWIKYTTLDCSDWGATTVKLKANPDPAQTSLDLAVLPARSYAR